MTSDEILDDLITREGGWRDAKQRPDGSWDPPTNWGITLTTLLTNAYLIGIPLGTEITEATLRGLTEDQARVIYVVIYMDRPGFTMGNIPFEPLRVQLIDYGVNSGPARAIRWLQRTLGTVVTGSLNDSTISEIRKFAFYPAASTRTGLMQLNDALVAARCEMIREAIAAGKIDKSDELGLLRRAISFTLTKS